MAILCKIYQDTRSISSKLFYARAVHPNTVSTKEIAEKIEQNTSQKASDVYAVLKELSNVVGQQLLQSNKVLLDGLGYFYIGVETAGALTADRFKCSRATWNDVEKYWDTKGGNVKKFHVGFTPVRVVDPNTGVSTKSVLSGVTAKEFEGYTSLTK